jgi:NAD(P)-dependent dehydrogenase (short-subunit alcohol dehydrogenase family)
MMQRQGRGKIINMTSVAARTGGAPGSVAHATAKGGVSTLIRAMARELVGEGILVNGVAPGVITTPFHDRFTPPTYARRWWGASLWDVREPRRRSPGRSCSWPRPLRTTW